MWCLHIQKEKRTTATKPMIGTREYSRVLKSWGFGENGLEVAAEGEETLSEETLQIKSKVKERKEIKSDV